MITRIPDYFHDFHCLAGACPDTCCGQWEIVVDEETAKRYHSMEGALGNTIRSSLTLCQGEYVLPLQHGRCPLLTKDNLCALISQTGEDSLCTTCREHPRFTEIFGGLQETALCISCPEAARLLLEHSTPVQFVTELDATLPEPDDLDADEFDMLLSARQTAFLLVQDRSRPLHDRLALLLCFAKRLQNNLQNLSVCEALCRQYETGDYCDRQLRRIRRKRGRGSLLRARQLFACMEQLTDVFPHALRDLECTDPDLYPQLEHLTIYFLFRWWLKAACNDCLWQQAAATVVSVLTVAGLAKSLGGITKAAQIFSKEIEHCEENLTLLKEAMELPMFSLDELLKLLEVSHAI